MLTLSHPSHQAKSPVYRGFKWVTPSEMLKPPKSGNNANIEARAKILDSKEKRVTQKRNFGLFSNFAFLGYIDCDLKT